MISQFSGTGSTRPSGRTEYWSTGKPRTTGLCAAPSLTRTACLTTAVAAARVRPTRHGVRVWRGSSPAVPCVRCVLSPRIMGGLDGLVPLGAGREAEVFLRPDGSVLKLMRSPDHQLRVEREAAALQTLAGPRHLAPRLREVVTVDGRPGLVAERIVGTDLLSLLTGSPWLFLRAATAIATTHAAMHECQAPASLPQLNDELRQRIELAPILRADLASYALDVLDGLPAGDRLCHGDFHPGNMMG